MTFKVFCRKTKNFFPYVFRNSKRMFYWWLANRAKRSPIRKLFPRLPNMCWRIAGAHIGKNVDIGPDVYYDVDYAKYITIEDDVWVASHSTIFAHRRVVDDYHKGDRYKDYPITPRPVLIKKGAAIGINTMIMPGVTIVRGAIVGAGSIVLKDIPDWCIAAGTPCKVLRYLPEHGFNYNKITKQNEPIPGYNAKSDSDKDED